MGFQRKFTGDAAALELRVLFAERGTQLVGPYSRFGWSHPGPLFFYLALPVYKLFAHHGPALNLFMLFVTATVTVGVVWCAWRLRGAGFAWIVLGVLATFERIAIPLIQTNEWNPVSPLLPFVLLSFVTGRMLLGEPALLPLFAFLGSAIVQTHVAYAPDVLGLTLLAAVGLGFWWRRGKRPSGAQLGTTLAVLAGCWMFPLWEMVIHGGGNLWLLFDFFTRADAPPPEWSLVADVLLRQSSVAAFAVLRAAGIVLPLGRMWLTLVAAAIVAVVGLSIWLGYRRRDWPTLAIGVVAATELAFSVIALRGIRGEVLPYLVMWTAVPGLLAVMLTPTLLSSTLTPKGQEALLRVAGSALLVVTVVMTFRDMRVVVRADPAVATVAAVVETTLRRQTEPTVITQESDREWPVAAGVILTLVKHGVPVYVEPRWTFLFGEQLTPPPGVHPTIRIEADSGGTNTQPIASGARIVVIQTPPAAF